MHNEVYVVGTSLTRGLGRRLSSQDADSTVYTYPGAHITLIRSRVPHIFPKDNGTKKVVIQCGGNDAENKDPDSMIDQYEGLIKDIRRQLPNAEILLSTIPHRGKDNEINRTISYVNDYLQDRGKRKDRVRMIDVVPKLPKYFTKDLVHCNESGKQLYTNNVTTSLVNFTRSLTSTTM